MKTDISIDTMRDDLTKTDSDILLLVKITSGLNEFINVTDQDRNSLKMDFYKYQSFLLQARKLRVTIAQRIQNAVTCKHS